MKRALIVAGLAVLGLCRGKNDGIDVSEYTCNSCIAQTSLFWCDDGSESGCCSGSNYYSDSCSNRLSTGLYCSTQVPNTFLKYATCTYSPEVCGVLSQKLLVNRTVQIIEAFT